MDLESLLPLGWKTAFSQQLSLEELEAAQVCRVMAVQRAGLALAPSVGSEFVPLAGRWFQLPTEERPTVGDWLVYDPQSQQIQRLLERTSVLKRITAGRTSEVQLIGANVDTLFIVSSCNQDFNPGRIERYLALAYNAGTTPVLILTKQDMTDSAEAYRERAQSFGSELMIELVDATDPTTLDGVRAWCGVGETVALVGSSGVGKSTLLNSLAGRDVQATGGIRDDDSKGRHTTTHRSLHPLPEGGLVLDSPGIRELQITDMDSGLETTFADVEALAQTCRFNDCQHHAEPGCAVRAAIDAGELDARRLANYEKLAREEQYARESTAERHARTRAFAKQVRNSQAQKNRPGTESK